MPGTDRLDRVDRVSIPLTRGARGVVHSTEEYKDPVHPVRVVQEDTTKLRHRAVALAFGHGVVRTICGWVRAGLAKEYCVTSTGNLLLFVPADDEDLAVVLGFQAARAWPGALVGWQLRQGPMYRRWVVCVRFATVEVKGR
ncbi:MAG: hypothetical protein JRM77_08870 [Nitrososphaerota archaeon]|jgi:hypothetical protein|nr:hypothetical protein [Nitrososphaerota archaeon]